MARHPGLAAQGERSVRISTVKGWRAAAGQAREDLVKQGVPLAFARKAITKLGHTELSLKTLPTEPAACHRIAARNSTRPSGCSCGPRPAPPWSSVRAAGRRTRRDRCQARRQAAGLPRPGRAVHDALLAGHDATGPATALRAAGDTALATAPARLRRAKPGSEGSLDATVAIKSALEAAMLGRFLLWRLGWTVPGLTGPVAAADEHAFLAEHAAGPSLVAAARRGRRRRSGRHADRAPVCR